MENPNEAIKCPLCGEELVYNKMKETHAWVCPVCPFVGFEYYDDRNTKDIMEVLK